MPRRTPSVARLVRGSVIVHRRRCGNPTCHCAGGDTFHESTVLNYSESGRRRFINLPKDLVKPVRASTDRYRVEKARLEEKGNAGLADLNALLAARKTS